MESACKAKRFNLVGESCRQTGAEVPADKGRFFGRRCDLFRGLRRPDATSTKWNRNYGFMHLSSRA